MVKVEAMVIRDRVETVIDAVEEATGHVGVTVIEAVGHGRQRGITHEYRGRVFESRFLPKAMLIFVVEDRIATLVVHDANLGGTALERGCTDLVIAGHLHVQKGPTRVVGTNGKAGYSYTNGTTGGAAYAIAIGSKLRRDAEFTLVTFRDGRPVGLQPVTVRTTGEISVAAYLPLELGASG